MFSSKAHLSVSLSLSLSLSLAFRFFPFLAAFLQLALHVYVLHCRGMLVLRRSGATGRIDRSTWGETTALTSHFTTCCSQVYTLGTCCTVSYPCVTLNMVEPGEKGSVKNSARTWKVDVGCSGLRIECFFRKVKIHSESWLKSVVEIVLLQSQSSLKFSVVDSWLEGCKNQMVLTGCGKRRRHAVYFPITCTLSLYKNVSTGSCSKSTYKYLCFVLLSTLAHGKYSIVEVRKRVCKWQINYRNGFSCVWPCQ